VLRVRGLVMCLTTLMAWGLAFRQYRIQAYGGGVQTQLNQLASQSAGNYGVESRTKINKQHSHIPPLLTVKMREGDSIACGSVWPAGELQRVHGAQGQ